MKDVSPGTDTTDVSVSVLKQFHSLGGAAQWWASFSQAPFCFLLSLILRQSFAGRAAYSYQCVQ